MLLFKRTLIKLLTVGQSGNVNKNDCATLLLEQFESRILLSGINVSDPQASPLGNASDIIVDGGDDQQFIVGSRLDIDGTFSFADAAQTYDALIDWGDGTAVEVITAMSPTKNTSLSAKIDYGLDVNNFFDTDQKKALLQLAADTLLSHFGDTLEAIVPSGMNSWSPSFAHPSEYGVAGAQYEEVLYEVPGLVVEENEIIIYAGGRDLVSLARGGYGGYHSSFIEGDNVWPDLLKSRGQAGALNDTPSDFAPWGGTISFDTVGTNWYFGETIDGIAANQNDFLSVAYHELGHLLGIGTAGSWFRFVDNDLFSGPASVVAYGGNVPVVSGGGHWGNEDILSGVAEPALDPNILVGTRKLLTDLDYAGLSDIGWALIPPTDGVGEFTGSHLYTTEGVYTATISVIDENEMVFTDSFLVDVMSVPPEGVIEGRMFYDANGNGLAQKKEQPISGMTVSLFTDLNNNQVMDIEDTVIASMVTDAQGRYTFTSLPGGNYIVLPDATGYTPTGPLVKGVALTTDIATEVVTPFGYYDPDALSFGKVNLDTKRISLKFLGYTYEMSGAGYGKLVINDDEVSVNFFDTNAKTEASIKAPKGTYGEINDITVAGDIKKVSMKTIDMVGDYTSAGSTAKLRVHDVVGPNSITIGAPVVARPDAMFTFEAKDVVDVVLTSLVPIKTVEVKNWLDLDDSRDGITAPWAKTIESRNDFQSDIILTDATQETTLHKLKVKSQISDAKVYVDGSIKTVSAGAIVDSIIYAGIDRAMTSLPLTANGFENKDVKIKTLNVKGVFVNTLVASYRISEIKLKDVNIDNNDVVHGVSASYIKALRFEYSSDGDTVKEKYKKLGGNVPVDPVDDFLVNILPVVLL